MSLILTAVTVSGVLTNKGLLGLGFRWLPLRYPLAVLASYLVFLGLVQVWIWYVAKRKSFSLSLGNLDLHDALPDGGSGGGAGGGSVGFSGGSSGGGGASGSWSSEMPAVMPTSPAPSSSGSSFLPDLDFNFDCDDDSWVILLVLGILVLVIFCAGGYLIYAAPQILPEAASQAVLAGVLTRVSKEHHHGWMPGVLRSTVIPFAMVLILAGVLGWVAHRHCPNAAKLMDALHCVAN